MLYLRLISLHNAENLDCTTFVRFMDPNRSDRATPILKQILLFFLNLHIEFHAFHDKTHGFRINQWYLDKYEEHPDRLFNFKGPSAGPLFTRQVDYRTVLL